MHLNSRGANFRAGSNTRILDLRTQIRYIRADLKLRFIFNQRPEIKTREERKMSNLTIARTTVNSILLTRNARAIQCQPLLGRPLRNFDLLPLTAA